MKAIGSSTVQFTCCAGGDTLGGEVYYRVAQLVCKELGGGGTPPDDTYLCGEPGRKSHRIFRRQSAT